MRPLCDRDAQNVGAWHPSKVAHLPCCTRASSWAIGNVTYPSPQSPACGPVAEHVSQYGLLYHGRPKWQVTTGGFGCSCVGHTERLEWQPYDCRLAKWDAQVFCKKLGVRRVVFIGDSTMEQSASAVINAVTWGHKNRVGPQARGCQQQLFVALSDTLVGRPLGRSNRGPSWRWYVRQLEPDVVVLSAGAHIYKDFESVLQRIWKDYVRLRQQQNVTIVWKTQQPGGCGPVPLRRKPSSENNGSYWARYSGDAFNWPLFEERDRWAREFWRERGVAVLDLDPLYYRVDAHISSSGTGGLNDIVQASFTRKKIRLTGYNGDCLHYCSPGPLATLVPRMLNHLLATGELQLHPERNRSQLSYPPNSTIARILAPLLDGGNSLAT